MKKLLVLLGAIASTPAFAFYNYTLTVNNTTSTPLVFAYNEGANTQTLPANKTTVINANTNTIYDIRMNNNAVYLQQHAYRFQTSVVRTTATNPYTLTFAPGGVNSGIYYGTFSTSSTVAPTGSCQVDGAGAGTGVACNLTGDNLALTNNSLTVTITGGPSGSGGTCGNAPTWNAATQYPTAGTVVVYNGVLYQNSWWTMGDNPASNSGPAGSGKVWINLGPC